LALYLIDIVRVVDRLNDSSPQQILDDYEFFRATGSRRATRTLVGMFGAAVLFTGICIYLAAMLTINTTSWKWAVIAAELGGRRIFPEMATPAERQLLNIVEEMAMGCWLISTPCF
jgi:hypothetical protein